MVEQFSGIILMKELSYDLQSKFAQKCRVKWLRNLEFELFTL